MVNLYGTTLYGTALYGGYSGSSLSVGAFTALPVGYNTLQLAWTTPTGDWTSLRLLKNTYGFSVNENDGMTIFDEATSTNAYTDTGLLDNTWYYYSLWLLIDDSWVNAGNASGFSVGYLGMVDWVLSSIPGYYLKVSDIGSNSTIELTNPYDTADAADANPHLFLFARILGWGLDYLKSYAQTTADANNPSKTHINNVQLLAQTLGIDTETQVSSALVRERVSNAGLLASTRGTLEGLAALGEAASGWSVQLSLSTNLMLNGDNSEMEHPFYTEWQADVSYVEGDHVQGSDNIYYEASASSINQDPTSTSGYWTSLAGTVSYALNPGSSDENTNVVSNWNAANTDGSALSAEILNEVINVNGPNDGAPTNVLQVKGNGAAFNGYVINGTQPYETTPVYTVESAVPIPQPYLWDADFFYADQSYAVYNGVAYLCTVPNSGQRPDIFTNSWDRAGVDDRVPLQYLFSAHAGWTGTTASASGTATAGLVFYDEYGKELQEVTSTDITNLANQGIYLETFGENPGQRWVEGIIDGLHNGYTIVDTSTEGLWSSEIDEKNNPVAVSHSTSLAEVSYTSKVSASGDAQCIAATFRSGDNSEDQRIVISYTDNNNMVYVSRLALVSVSGGIPNVLTTLSTPISDDQRVLVEYFVMTGVIKIYADGVQIGTATVTAGSANEELNSGLMVIEPYTAYTNLATNPSFETTSGTVIVRTNLCPNPKVASGSDWDVYPGTGGTATGTSTAGSGLGTGLPDTFYRYTQTGAATSSNCGAHTSSIPVTGGATYTISAYVRTSVSLALNIQFSCADSSGTKTYISSYTNRIPTNTWTLVTFTSTIPSTTVTMQADFYYSEAASVPVGATLDATAVLLEQTSVALPYFDGSFSPDSDMTASWTGTANASTSVLTAPGVYGNDGSSGAVMIRSSQQHENGSYSARIIPNSSTNSTSGNLWGVESSLPPGIITGHTYYIQGTCILETPQTGTLSPNSRVLNAYLVNGGSHTSLVSNQAPNTVGSHKVSLTFTVPDNTTGFILIANNGASIGNGDVWWDDVMLVDITDLSDSEISQLETTGYFDGSNAPAGTVTQWTGTANASTSEMWYLR